MQSRTKTIDLTGQKFGRLTVLYRVGSKDNRALWHCKCDCGNEKNVVSDDLRGFQVQSCGCLKSSGEEKIQKILTNYNIPFQREKTFENFRFQTTKGIPRFDFFVNDKYLIEYDGIQHFQLTKWYTKETFQETILRDKEKNQWCKENNIPLIRIPYTHLNDLCIEDLQLETSKFIVN